MTATSTKVFRVTEQSYVTLYTKPRPIVVGIVRGDLLEFRGATGAVPVADRCGVPVGHPPPCLR